MPSKGAPGRRSGNRGTAVAIVWRNGRACIDGRKWGRSRWYALCPPGQSRGTTDETTAKRLALALVAEWEGAQVAAARLGLRPDNDLAGAGDEHIRALREAGRSSSYINYTFRCLERALDFFDTVQAQMATTAVERRRCQGPRNLSTISVPDVRAYVRWLSTQGKGRRDRRGGGMGPGTIREHLAALSGVFSRAISDGRLPLGHNPVAALMDGPSAPKSTTDLLEPWECALLLESARTLSRAPAGGGAPLDCAYELLAFYLYTGAREGEVGRAEIHDLHFDPSPAFPTGWIRIRGTKSENAERVVPMHPHHREILLAYLRRVGRAGGRLFINAADEPVGDWRKTLDRIAGRAGFEAGKVRTRRFRTSYATHRCTCDGADANMVRLELGHSDLQLLANTYAKAQRRSERMGQEFTYRLDRWAHQVEPGVLKGLAA